MQNARSCSRPPTFAGQWLRLRFWQAAAFTLYLLYRHQKAVRSLFVAGLVLYLTSAAFTFLILSLSGL